MEVRDLIEELKRMDPLLKVKLTVKFVNDFGPVSVTRNADRVKTESGEVVIEGT